MNRIIASLILFCATSLGAPQPVSAITIDTVAIGNVGNTPDPTVMTDGTSGYGSVAYAYRIGTYEVTNAQYAAFLNAKAKSDPLTLWSENMGGNARGGITRSGTAPNRIYTTKPGMDNKPVNYVTWYDAIRFTNWLHNGQGNGDTETGAYTLLGGTIFPSNGASITRNSGALWFLPSENEWYKAAFHQPAAQGGDGDDYWAYPNASNTAPTIAAATTLGDISNPGVNVSNYADGADWNGQDGNVTTVGSAGPLSAGFYGTFDQGGNVVEWNETIISSLRGARGADWTSNLNRMLSSDRPPANPVGQNGFVGFRVARVPEPDTLALTCIAFCIVALWWQRHFK